MRARRVLGIPLRMIRSCRFFRRLARILFSPVALREATQADMVEVGPYINSQPDTPSQIPVPNVTHFVAHRKDKIVGLVQLVRRDERDPRFSGYWLFGLYVWPWFRGIGIGELLSRRVMDQARNEGVRGLSLVVFEDNRPALRMYEKLGFERITIPGLEEELATDKTVCGKRRVVMRCRFN